MKDVKMWMLALIGMTILLAALLPFVADTPDGLGSTMEHAGVKEGEPVYKHPIDFGEGYIPVLLMGLVGIGAVLVVVYVLGMALKS
ncbi:MAG: hypothetical protein BME93_01855 [Methanosarcinales archaeon Met12]|nr:MAG: hypothetical protein BME93_01855 [Methanosarcinales archaeon Met12]